MATRIPKIVIDARMISAIPHGIAMYVEGIARTLLEHPALKDAQGTARARFIFLINQNCPPNSVVRKFETITCKSASLSVREWFEIPRILREVECDLFHIPSFDSFLTLPCKHIQTVHDLNHLFFGGVFHRLYYRILLKRSIRNAQKVYTVSQFIKRQLQVWTGMSEDHFSVAYNRIDEFDPGNTQSDAGAYFLCVSNSKPHKNLALLIEAYRQYRDQVGEKALPLWITIEEYDGEVPEGVCLTGPIPHDSMFSLIKGARAFVFPSLYEGFGRPPVEAALLGTAVLASDIPPHREGLAAWPKDQVTFLDPTVPSVWAKSMVTLTQTKHAPFAHIENPYSGEKLIHDYLKMYGITP